MKFRRFTASLLFPFSLVVALAAEPGMVFIPSGEFLRGRSHALPDDDLKWRPVLLKDSRPARPITLNPFYVDEHEVTNAQYATFLKAMSKEAPYYWPGGKLPDGKAHHPVVNVSWHDAGAYCAWAGKRLPTEAEWERAARGLAEGAKYPWGERDATKDDAHYDVLDGTREVCQYPKNYFGLCDVTGNVWEWTADWYGREYYQRAPQKNPLGPKEGMYRVLRGGSWADTAKYLTCAYRSFARPKETSPNIGFRCAKSLR